MIVDDVCDSGETFHKIKNFITGPRKNSPKTIDCDVRFAVLYWNNECNFEPHYYAQEIAKDSTNTWINFCWEAWWNTPV